MMTATTPAILYLLFITLLPFVAGCQCATDPYDEDPEGIMRTFENGILVEDDPTDWQPRNVTADGGFVAIAGAYPNPANTLSTIRFRLAQGASVSLVVRNGSGEIVRELVKNQMLEAGDYAFEWDLKDGGGNPVPVGLYRVLFDATTVGSSPKHLRSFGDIEVQR